MQYTPHDAADVNYVEQLLMSAIDNAAEKVTVGGSLWDHMWYKLIARL